MKTCSCPVDVSGDGSTLVFKHASGCPEREISQPPPLPVTVKTSELEIRFFEARGLLMEWIRVKTVDDLRYRTLEFLGRTGQ